MKQLFPPRLIMESEKKNGGFEKVDIEFVIIEDNMEKVAAFRKKHKIPLDSFPTIVKVQGKVATTYEGPRTKRAFFKFLK